MLLIRDETIDGCTSKWMSVFKLFWKIRIKSKIVDSVQTWIQGKIDENLESFSPLEDMVVHYRITNMTWTEESIMFEARAALSTTFDGKEQTYMPKKGKMVNNNVQLHAPKENVQAHLLQGLSISKEFLSRFVCKCTTKD